MQHGFVRPVNFKGIYKMSEPVRDGFGVIVWDFSAGEAPEKCLVLPCASLDLSHLCLFCSTQN